MYIFGILMDLSGWWFFFIVADMPKVPLCTSSPLVRRGHAGPELGKLPMPVQNI